ncbi:MAG: hypothetical protein AB7G11_17410 [Phycisphaerales bacterium]
MSSSPNSNESTDPRALPAAHAQTEKYQSGKGCLMLVIIGVITIALLAVTCLIFIETGPAPN